MKENFEDVKVQDEVALWSCQRFVRVVPSNSRLRITFLIIIFRDTEKPHLHKSYTALIRNVRALVIWWLRMLRQCKRTPHCLLLWRKTRRFTLSLLTTLTLCLMLHDVSLQIVQIVQISAGKWQSVKILKIFENPPIRDLKYVIIYSVNKILLPIF